MTKKERKAQTGTPIPAVYKVPADKSDKKIKMLLVLLYLAVDFIPNFGGADVMGVQWLYYAVLNLLVSLYTWSTFKNRVVYLVERFSKNALSLAVLAFFILCGISIFFALNPVESLVVYVRLIITIVAMFNLAVLLYDENDSIEKLLQAISIVALLQSIPLLISFLTDIKTLSTNIAVSHLLGNAGNKNIVASSLVLKLPAIMYCLYKTRPPYLKLLNVVNACSLLLTTLMILILNARSSYVGVLLQIILTVIFIFLSSGRNERKVWLIRLSVIISLVAIGVIVSQILIKAGEKTDESGQYTTVGKRLATLTDHTQSSASARLFFWDNAWKQIKSAPITGCGYGNWKIQSIRYEREFYDDFNYSKHAHNDFIQVSAEAGIQTGLVFLSIFVIAFIFTLRIVFSSHDDTSKALIAFAFISLMGYAVDATFNFPAERPVMQIYFAIALAIILIIYIGKTPVSRFMPPSTTKTIISFLIFTGSALALYVTYETYMSMRVQSMTHFNFGTMQQGVTWQDVNAKFPSIPNLAENNIPINDTKAWYLFKGGRFDEALSLLDQDKNANPYSMSKEWLKASIYMAINKLDSAHYYSKKGFFERPRNFSLYNIVTRTSVPLKDSVTIRKAFEQYRKYRNEPGTWRIFLRSSFAVDYQRNDILKITDSISKVFPEDVELQHTKYFIHAGKEAMNKNYRKALVNLLEIDKLYPNDAENQENIGLTYYYLADYAQASVYFKRVVDSKAYNNGKSEFYLGNALLQLNRRGEACAYLQSAANKNYPMAAILFNRNSCELGVTTQ